MQGFRKVDPDKWEFANEGFLRGQKHLLKNIKRRKNATSSSILQASNQGNNLESCIEVGRFGLDGEIDSLKRDKQVLMAELVKLRQQQQQTNAHLKGMERKIKGNELKLKQATSFLARAMKNPTFLQQMVEQKGKMKEIDEAISKKRMKRIDYGQDILDDDVGIQELGQLGEDESVSVKLEPQEFGGVSGFDDLEFEALAMDMQEPMPLMNMGSDQIHVQRFDDDRIEDHLITADDGSFWGDLINETIEGLDDT